ncbi:MAG TPA: PIN domain-containing protein [Xanthobacteraceae bacterium]
MPSIIVDAGPLVALFDRDDHHHRRAVEFAQNDQWRLISNIPVLTEATFLLRFSVESQRDFLWWAERTLDIDQRTIADLPRIIAVLEKYQDLSADFADASLVALAERLDVSRIASVDSDFAVYRMAGSRPFENVFLD